MFLRIESSRFGDIEVRSDSIIEFPSGLIGIAGNRYTLLGRSEDSPFLWLQSLDDPQLALPVCDPRRHFTDYRLELMEADADRIGTDDLDEAHILVTVRAGDTPEDCFVNLRGPIVIWDGRGHQVINRAPGCELRKPLFATAERRESAAPAELIHG